MAHQLSNDDLMRLIGATHEAARIMIWVREKIGWYREMKRLTPKRHVRKHHQLDAILAPLFSLERRIQDAHLEMQAACKRNK